MLRKLFFAPNFACYVVDQPDVEDVAYNAGPYILESASVLDIQEVFLAVGERLFHMTGIYDCFVYGPGYDVPCESTTRLEQMMTRSTRMIMMSTCFALRADV